MFWLCLVQILACCSFTLLALHFPNLIRVEIPLAVIAGIGAICTALEGGIERILRAVETEAEKTRRLMFATRFTDLTPKQLEVEYKPHRENEFVKGPQQT